MVDLYVSDVDGPPKCTIKQTKKRHVEFSVEGKSLM